MKAKAQFDFAAQADSNELNLLAGDILTIIRQDVGDGWWEGINQRNERGLFPISYVEVLSSNGESAPPPFAPPPPLPEALRQSLSMTGATQQHHATNNRDSWGDEDHHSTTPASRLYPAVPPSHSTGGDFDDDWSDDDDSQAGTEYNRRESHQTVINSNVNIDSSVSKSFGKDGGGSKAGGTVKKSMNRFSPFVKSGTEGYLLNTVKLTSKPSETIEIVNGRGGDKTFEWAPSEVYTCQISSRQKASKMHGLKSFIAYQLTPSISQVPVSRRYKHFDWLVSRLQEKYTVVFVPPLPEKQVTGRYEEDFVEHRMNLLQMWLNRVCRHPVLSRSEVWVHFLTCTDEKEWKRGKRKAEKDELSNGLLFYAIKLPANVNFDPSEMEQQVELFSRQCRHSEESVRNFQSVANDNVKRMVGPFKREFLRIGAAFRSLVISFESGNPMGHKMGQAMLETASCYEKMGLAYEEQPRCDWLPLLDELFMHRGTLNNIPEVLQGHKSASTKFRESQRLCEEGKVSGQELELIKNRLDVVSAATLAEIHHFEKERLVEFNRMMKNFLESQIGFYEGFVSRLREAAKLFE